MQIKPYYNGFSKSVFVRSMISIFNHKNYNHEQFIIKLSQVPTMLRDAIRTNEYKFMIEDIYNYRSKNKVSLRY